MRVHESFRNAILSIIRNLLPGGIALLVACELPGRENNSAVPNPVPPSEKPMVVAMSKPTAPAPAAEVDPAPIDETAPAGDTPPGIADYIDRMSSAMESSDTPNVTIDSPAQRAAAAQAGATPRASRGAPVAVPLDDAESQTAAGSGAIRLAADSETAIADPPPVAPRIGRVTARAATEAWSAPEAASQPLPQSVSPNAPTQTARIPTSLKGFLDQYVTDRDGGTFRQQLDERILRVLAGDYESARKPMTLVSDAEQKMTTSIVNSLISTRDANLGRPDAMDNGAVAALQQLTQTLRDFGQLRIPTTAICWKVTGFGAYDTFDPPNFPAGRDTDVIVYVEVEGFASRRGDDGWHHTQFELTTTLLDRAGNSVAKFHAPDVSDRCRNRRNDCFIPHLIRLPATLAPGDYVAKVTLADKLANKVAESRAPLRITTGL